MSSLPPSELGKKEYWEDFYSLELANFDDHGDCGEIWFGTKNLQRIIKCLIENEVSKAAAILDVGCGNGMTLVYLAKAGFTNLTGVDYAQEAILLAEKVAKENNVVIKFETLDFLNNKLEEDSILKPKSFHVIIDKGTYDAVCLDRDFTHEKRENYIKQVSSILSPEGYFLLFSCNWTKQELLSQFRNFKLHEEIEIPTFGFGGQSGQTVTALVLKII